MPLPFSRSQIRKLGERLRAANPPTEADQTLLRQLIADYAAPLAYAESVLREELDFNPRGRLKTDLALIEKLGRGTDLDRMQDIAGLRVSEGIGLGGYQSALTRRIRARLGGKIVDRRRRPMYGYRAVHVIINVDDHLIEIQLRTMIQHRWAVVYEALADLAGRGIRYGEPPSDPSWEPLVREMDRLATAGAALEAARYLLIRMDRVMNPITAVPVEDIEQAALDEELQELAQRGEDLRRDLSKREEGYLRVLGRVEKQIHAAAEGKQ